MIKQWTKGLLYIVLAAVLSISSQAQLPDAPSTVKDKNAWRVVPTYKEKSHLAFISEFVNEHPTRTKWLGVAIVGGISLIFIIKSHRECDQKFYDGVPYSGQGVNCESK